MGQGMAKLSVSLTSERLLMSAKDVPTAREAHSTVDISGGRLLVFGGGSSNEDEPEQYNDVHFLDVKEHTWTKIKTKGTPPAPRTGQAAAYLPDGRLLIFGGCSMDSGYLDDTYFLDTSTFTWTQRSLAGSPPTPRDKHIAVTLGSKVYVFGGFGPQPTECSREALEETTRGLDDLDEWETDEEEPAAGTDFTWFNDLHLFDAATNTWSEVATSGQIPSPRAAAAAVLVHSSKGEDSSGDPQLVLFGGRDSKGRQNDLCSLDLTSLEWRQERPSSTSSEAVSESENSQDPASTAPSLPAAPAARSFHATAPLTGRNFSAALLYGGVGLKNENFQGLDVLNTKTMEWSSVGSLEGTWPSPRGACSMNVVQESPESSPKLVIFGGSSDWEGGKAGFHNDVFVADLSPLVKVLEESESQKGQEAGRQAAQAGNSEAKRFP